SLRPLHFFSYSSLAHRDLHSFPTRRSSDLPASRPITSIPACANGRHATPPAAPSPTITTLVFLSVVAMAKLPPSKTSRNRKPIRSEEHTSELQSRRDLVCRLLLEKKKKNNK